MKYLFFTCIILVVALVLSIWMGLRQKAETDRLRNNQRVLLSPNPVRKSRLPDNKSVAETEALTLKVAELRSSNDSLLRQIHALGIRSKRVERLAQTTTETHADVETTLTDTIVRTANSTDTLRCLSYNDPWITLDGCVRADTFQGEISTRDTLDFIVHRVPRRFLFFRFGCKAILLDAVSHNPHSTITHTRYVKIGK